MSMSEYRAKFVSVLALCGVDANLHSFRLYSLRRGGATHWYEVTGAYEECMRTGRWQNLKTCRLYVQGGEAALAGMKLPAVTRRLVKLASPCWYDVVGASLRQ